jgi:hypothetical protein
MATDNTVELIAQVRVRGPGRMTKAGRKRIAKWLRSRADWLEKHGELAVSRGWFKQDWYAVKEKRK